MLRSEDMVICDIYIQTDAGFDIIREIGELECVQFLDMNKNVNPVDKRFVTDICRCNQMEQSLYNMRDELLTSEGLRILRLRDLSHIKPLHPSEMFEFENMVEGWAKDVKDMAANHVSLQKLLSETKEIHYVLQNMDPIVGDVETGHTILPKHVKVGTDPVNVRKLKIITGVVDRSTTYAFQTMLWRITHGHVYYREASRDESFWNPVTGHTVRKVAFVVICHGDELHHRILKVCNGFNINLYRWPETHEDRMATLRELSKRKNEVEKVLQRTVSQRYGTYHTLAQEWEGYLTQVIKAKAIYHQLNLFNLDITGNTLIGQCWIIERNYAQVESILELASALGGGRSFMVKATTEGRYPTYYKTNKFTKVFQNIISSYQVGQYKELNPGIFTIITFPFFFGVMFGDVGHGFILLMYAFWMVHNEKKYMYRRSTNQLWNFIFEARYLILLMSFFTIFMGFLYNEWFSMSTKMMLPFWLNTWHYQQISKSKEDLYLKPEITLHGYVYKYGIDPGLKLAKNNLLIENSVKMKLSIILGLSHVCFGIILSIWNCFYFKKYVHIILHCIPQLIFVCCIYGWLVYAIFHKWLVTIIGKQSGIELDLRHHMPTLTDEFLNLIFWQKLSNQDYISALNYFEMEHVRKNYESLKTVVYHIGIACFPIMILTVPIYLLIVNTMKTMPLQRKARYRIPQMQLDSQELKRRSEFSFWYVLFKSLCRTLEFGLATVTHMASYLRLWALSMAHTLLSDFVWEMTMRKYALYDYSLKGAWKIFLVFIPFAILTMIVLIMMDSLAIFVHVLRIHWIEFMSKFFKGGGVPFYPFTFANVVDERDYEQEEEYDKICRIRKARSEGEYY